MPVAIKTAYLGYTNTRSSRVKASVMDSGRPGEQRTLTLNWDHLLDSVGNHEAAAKALAERLGWAGDWHMADGGDFYVWVRAGVYSHHFTIADKRAEAATNER
ncbi:hypothetical protein [Aminobacter sp. HY435]|uniref:hypothetical protein n=1 Tax=Aminobacter sp. HY435 TaxID=2970917 RepID=UPI0022B9A6DE|nr:hypothetical protein [Aminobacter sp. HY435]